MIEGTAKKNRKMGVMFQQPLNPLLERVYQNQLQYREILLNDDVSEDCIELVTVQIMNFNKEDDEAEEEAKKALGDDYRKIFDRATQPITLFINSYGGSVLDGLSVVSAIKSSRTPIHTIALGKAMSMGFMILVAGHRRFCQRYSWMMYHQLSAGTGRQTARDIEEYSEHLGDLQKMLEEVVSECTLIPAEMTEAAYLQKYDLYLDAAQALEYGVVDEII